MAITLTYSPYSISGVFNPMRFAVTSDATATDLKVKAKIEYSRNGTDYTSLGWLYGNKEGNEFTFDVSNRLRSVLSWDDINDNSSLFVVNTPNSIVTYKLTFVEQYANALGLQEDFETLPVTSFYGLNGTYLKSEPQNFLNYLLTDSHSKFLTDAPLSKVVRGGEQEQLSFLFDVNDHIGDISGMLTIKLAIEKATTSQLNIATDELLLKRGTILLNVDDYLTDDVKSLSLWVADEHGDALSETRKFIIDRSCHRSYYRLCWLNSKGGFDCYTFLGIDTEKVSFNKTEYRQYLDKDFKRSDSELGTFSSERKTVISASSMWTNIATRRWLAGLFASPKVWLIDENTRERIAINIWFFEKSRELRG